MEKFGDAFILCGGKSRRMGFDKSLLKIGDEYVINIMADKLLEIFDSVRLCANGGEKFADFGIEILEDEVAQGVGPSAAIHGALAASKSQFAFIIAVDMPFINIQHILHMKKLIENATSPMDALIPLTDEHKEALYGFYNISALPKIAREIEEENFAMHRILTKLDSVYISEDENRTFDPELTMFANLNYQEDLAILGNLK